MKSITKENFSKETSELNKTFLIDFWSPTCSPCLSMGKIIDSLNEELKNIEILKVNASIENELVQKFEIMGLPTFIIIKNNKVIKIKTGAMSKQDFINFIS